MSTPTFRAGATVTHPHFPLLGLPEQAVIVEVLDNGAAELDNGRLLPTAELTLVDTGERWLDVAGYDGIYQVSSHGKVVSTRFKLQAGRERLLTAQRAKTYPLVALSNGPRREQVGLNRLVAQHFLPAPDEARKTHLIPRDGNQLNLRWDNLQWVDPNETADKAVADHLRRSGADHYRSKLTAEQIAEAQQVQARPGRRTAGQEPGPTLTDLATRFGVSRQALIGARRKPKTPPA